MSEITESTPDLLERIGRHQPLFLNRWSLRMAEAGYLQHTTAKRVDCILALDEFLRPILDHAARHSGPPEFRDLVRNEGDWSRFLTESARRHRMRGVPAEMFLGCFKTFIHSLLDVVEHLEAPPWRREEAARLIRLYGDALEVLFLQDWTRFLPELTEQKIDEMNRLLTLEKCRFENILNSTSDLILVVDSDGLVVNANAAVRDALPVSPEEILGRPVWKILDLEGRTVEELLRYYPVGITCELAPFGESAIYRMQITPLNSVSLASDQYIVVLTNITTQAMQRETLERIVDEKTEALRKEKEQLEEMNITLRNVLKSIDREREEQADNLAAKVSTLVLPALERIENESDAAIRKGYTTVVADQLRRLVPGGSGTDPLLLKLTHMEMKVCQFIRSGHSTKDIADHLNLSVETIQTHRKNIRRKLGLLGSNVSLYAHLATQALRD